jgi:uncharacterized protein (DUF983 family)
MVHPCPDIGEPSDDLGRWAGVSGPFGGCGTPRWVAWATVNPYGSLEPVPRGEPDAPLYADVGALTVLLRGARKRCPRCAERRIFASWFRLARTCPCCGLLFEKETGGFLGAMTLNYVASVGVWLVVLGIWLAVTAPDVPVTAMLVASAVLLVVVPLWFYPRSKAIWAAVEFLVLRSDPDYRAPVRRDPRTGDLE